MLLSGSRPYRSENDSVGALHFTANGTGQFGLNFAGTAEFSGNKASGSYATGGAIYSLNDLTINGGTGAITFSQNYAPTAGGAITAANNLTIKGGAGNITFSQNSAGNTGGAIYTGGALTINGGAGTISFSGNNAGTNGGAIYTSSNSITLRAGSGGIAFLNNHAANNGGAIYTRSNQYGGSNLTLIANEGDITFSGNTADTNKDDNAIYISNTYGANVNLQATNTHEIHFDDAISGNKQQAIIAHINQSSQDTEYTGKIRFTTSMTLGQVNQHNGTFELSGEGTTLKSNYTLNQGTYELTDGATGYHETFNQHNGELKVGGTLDATTFNYNDGSFKIDGKLNVDTFYQNGGDLKAGSGSDDNLVLGTDGSMDVDDYQLKTGSLTIGEGADKLTIGNLTLNTDTKLTVEENATLTVSNSLTNSGSLILKPQSNFILQNGDYTTPATEHNFSAGTTFEIGGKYTLSKGATIKVSGQGSVIKAKTIALSPGSTLHFTIDGSAKGSSASNAMLNLNQTDSKATEISLKDVTITVDSATATAAKQRAARTGTVETVYLLSSNKGFTIDEPTSNVNELYKVTVQGTDAEVYRYGEEKAPDPDPDPNPGTDPDPQPGTGEGGSQGGGSLIAVRDPRALERIGATGNQASAFSIFENGTFAAGTPEARFFKAKGGIFEVTQQDGSAGLNALSALLPHDAPLVLDTARATTDFLRSAAFDHLNSNTGKQALTGPTLDESGRISAALSATSTLWLKARLNSVDTERYDNGSAGYDGDLSLVALGLDTALSNEWTLGLGLGYSRGDLDGLCRSVESEGYSLFTYGQYRTGSWYLNGLLSVSLDDYEEDNQVLAHSLKSDYRATTLYGGIFTGLELSTTHGTFSPELGLSVLSTKLSDYESGLSDDIEADRATISSALAGFKWQLNAISTETVALSFKGALHVRYDLSTEGVDYDVGLSNGSHLKLTGEDPDRFAVMPSLGVSLKLGQSRAFELEASYSAELSEHFTGQAFSLGLGYRF